MKVMAANVIELLTSSAKIDRDRGVIELQKCLKAGNGDESRSFEAAVQNWLSDKEAPWETKHGALLATKALLEVIDGRPQCSDEFVRLAEQGAMLLLEYTESRVRLAAGEVIGELCRRNGPEVYVSIKDRLIEGVQCNLERKPLTDAELQEQQGADKLIEKLSSGPTDRKQRRNSADAEQIFHDTAGWKSLETWMKCLQCAINGCGRKFDPHIDQDLLELVFQTLNHTNRFVRETGYYVCGALVGCNASSEEEVSPNENSVYRHGDLFAQQLAKGLADNWSQVRLASSAAAREFLMGLPNDGPRQKFFPILIPPLCLNRYYVAEGVRIYNQKTWAQLTEGRGKEFVEMYIKEVVTFYVAQSEADNHAVREAACACIAELGSKIDQDVVRPWVAKLLDALLVCFKDQSWPVRDAACVACGNFVSCFPEECRSSMDTLYVLFYENLEDNIPSVRQGAAIALVNVVRAYGNEAMERVVKKCQEGLEGVAHQPDTSEKYANLDKAPATYGVVKRMRDNDMDLHTDKQMYSCGSLAPKMHRGGTRSGGCMDHQFRRPSEPWELGEGCVNVVAELSRVPEASSAVNKMIPQLAKAASHRHYTHHINFLESVCKVLIIIAKGVGKRAFKMHLELFLDDIFYSLSCDNPLTSTAASQCLSQLSTFLGANILRGRIEQFNPRYLQQLPVGPPM